MSILSTVLALALASAPPSAASASTDAETAATTPPSQSAPAVAPSRSVFGTAIAEMTRSLQAEAAAQRAATEPPGSPVERTAAVDRDE
jgi:hypothetical protein